MAKNNFFKKGVSGVLAATTVSSSVGNIADATELENKFVSFQVSNNLTYKLKEYEDSLNVIKKKLKFLNKNNKISESDMKKLTDKIENLKQELSKSLKEQLLEQASEYNEKLDELELQVNGLTNSEISEMLVSLKDRFASDFYQKLNNYDVSNLVENSMDEFKSEYEEKLNSLKDNLSSEFDQKLEDQNKALESKLDEHVSEFNEKLNNCDLGNLENNINGFKSEYEEKLDTLSIELDDIFRLVYGISIKGNDLDWKLCGDNNEYLLIFTDNRSNNSDIEWPSDKSSVEKIITGSNVKAINKESFEGYTNLISANMPSVTTIGESAFSGCTNLTSVSMPNVMNIGESAFANCTSLKVIDLSSITDLSPLSISTNAFEGCAAMDAIIVNSKYLNYSKSSLPSSLSNVISKDNKNNVNIYPGSLTASPLK